MSLRDLDDRIVPRMAEALDRVARLFPKPPEPTGPLPVILRLRRLDDRWTAAGPLAVLRDVPQLGALLIGALLLVNGVTAGNRVDRRPGTEAGQPGAVEDLLPFDGTLGPGLGEKVDSYVAETKATLRRYAPGRPDGTVIAVISFTAYRTPEQVAEIVGPLQVRRILDRPPVKLPEGAPRQAALQDVVNGSKRMFVRHAIEREREARNLRGVIDTNDHDPAQKAEDTKNEAIALREAKLLRGPCACIYGVVVRARLRLLMDALNLPGIRTIDISNVDAKLDEFTYSALLPEEKTVHTNANQE